MKALRTTSLLAAMALTCCAIAFVLMALWPAPTTPTCDGEPMAPGGYCGYSQGGGSVTHSNGYEGQLESNKETRLIKVWSISFFAMLGTTVLVSVKTTLIHRWVGENRTDTTG